MISTLFIWIFNKFILKGGVEMLAMLMAIRIVDGLYTFKRVPKRFKEEVRSILISMDAEDLAVEE